MTEYCDKTVRDCEICNVRSPLFNLLTNEELRLVKQNKITVKFRKGETIRKQGTHMSHVISLNGGLAKMFLEGVEQKNVIIRIIKPTSFIGGPGMYVGQIHHFSITALVDSVVCFIDIKIFKQLLNENKEFAEEFMKDFSLNILSVYNRLIYLTQKQVHGKMADSLLYLFEDVFESLKFKMVLSKEDLADLSAMSKDGAVRVLKEFQNEGIIRFENGEIELLDPEALKKISRIG